MSDVSNCVTDPIQKVLSVAVGQIKPLKSTCMASSLTHLKELAIEANNLNADVLVLPELFLGGGYVLQGIKKRAVTSHSLQMKEAQRIAMDSGVSLIFGYAEANNDIDKTVACGSDVVFNSAVVIEGGSGSILHNYRKTHLFGKDEKKAFALGCEIGDVFTLKNRRKETFRASLLICYDIEFPEAARKCAVNSAEILFVPTANMIPYDKINRMVVPTRALENHVGLVYCNWTSYKNEENVEFNGESSVISTEGDFVHKLGRYDNGIKIVDLSMKTFSNSIKAVTEPPLIAGELEDNYISDRRPELYHA